MQKLLDARLQKHVRSEAGSLTIFSLFLFIMILMIAGMAVDMMMHERNRTRTQNIIDVASLACASTTQRAATVDCIESYLVAANVDPNTVTFGDVNTINTYLAATNTAADDVTYGTSDGETLAWAFSNVNTDTIFMGLLGVHSLGSSSNSIAVERVSAVEVSLVLDFTSSMKGDRIAALRESVHDFVNVVFGLNCANDVCVAPLDPPDVTVNVIPYGGTVNPGRYMAAEMGLVRWHGYSSCGVIPQSRYSEIGLPHGSELQYPHYYHWNRRDLSRDQEFGWCPQDNNTILYAETDPQKIKDYVDSLYLNDGTGTDIGTKWGIALLDPSARDEITAMAVPVSQGGPGIVTGNTTGEFPQDYDSHILKVAVVMTDGGITDQYQAVGFDYDDIYDLSSNTLYAQNDPDTGTDNDDTRYWRYGSLVVDNTTRELVTVDADGNAVAGPANGSLLIRYASDGTPFFANIHGDTSLEPTDGQDVFNVFRDADRTYDELGSVERSISNNARKDERNSGTSVVTRDQAIANMTAQCNLAREAKSNGNEKITVFTIRLLESKQWTEDYMKPCATDPETQYYDVKSVSDLAGAFTAIGLHINNLKLTLVN